MSHRLFLKIPALAHDMETAENEARSQEHEWAEVLARLEQLPTCGETKAMFQRFSSGEISLKQLSSEIDAYQLRRGEARGH